MTRKLFDVVMGRSAIKRLPRLHPKIAAMIRRRLRQLVHNPRPHNSIKLKGTKSSYRLRVGEYRILYEIDYDTHVVTVFRVMHRGEGY